jgi:putative inorganic carbon (HCO3(-)) transporter
MSQNKALKSRVETPAVPALAGVWQAGLAGLFALGVGALLSELADRVGSVTRVGLVVVGAIGSLAAISQPDLALAGFVFMVYTYLSDISINVYSAPSLGKPFVALLVGIILIRWLIYRDRFTGLVRPLALFSLYALLNGASMLYGADFAVSSAAWVNFLKDAVMALSVICLMQSLRTWNRMLWALLAAGLLMATITTVQGLTGTYSNAYGGFATWILGPSGEHRLAGPIGDPNFYAQLLIVIVPLALDRLWSEKHLVLRLTAGWAVMVLVLAIIFTGSRGGFLALAVAVILMFIRRPPAPLPLIITVLAAALVLQLAPGNYASRLESIALTATAVQGTATADASITGRASETEVAWLMFRDYPILGVGFANYPGHYDEYSRRLGLDPRVGILRQPHSLYLEIASETGLVGLILFAFLMREVFGSLRRAAKAFNKIHERDAGSQATALAVGYVGYFTAGLFLHNAYTQTFWMLMGIALAAANIAQRELLEQRADAYER